MTNESKVMKHCRPGFAEVMCCGLTPKEVVEQQHTVASQVMDVSCPACAKFMLHSPGGLKGNQVDHLRGL